MTIPTTAAILDQLAAKDAQVLNLLALCRFEGYDAIIGRTNYFGSHVSRAARIEPITTPGCAFISEQFAAALATTAGHDFTCEYLGMQPLAKDYDICTLYRLTGVL